MLFFAPEGGGYFLEAPNFDAANALKTPPHIAPVWYFLRSTAILRAIPSFAGTQVWGVIGMGAAVVLIALLPWLDKGEVKSVRYRGPIFKTALVLFIIAFIGLGILGAMVATDTRTLVARILSFVYFAFFLGMPFYTKLDTNKPVPERVTMSTTKQKLCSLFTSVLPLSVLTCLQPISDEGSENETNSENWFAALLLAVPMSAAVASGGHANYEKSTSTCVTKSACSTVRKSLQTTVCLATLQAVCASTV